MRAGGSAVVGGLLGLAVGAIALGLAMRDIDLRALAAAFARAGVMPIVVGATMHVGVQVVYALRWRILLGRADLALPRAVGIVGLGYLANYTLPGRPGEVVRAGLIRGLAGVPLALGLATLLLEKILDGVTILLSAGAFVFAGGLPPWLGTSVAVGAAGFAVGAVLLLAAAGSSRPAADPTRPGSPSAPGDPFSPAHHLAAASPISEFVRARLTEVGQAVRNLSGARALAAVAFFGCVSWLAIFAQLGLLCTSVGIAPDPRSWLLLYAALGLASVVPGAPGYIGTYQLAAVSALGAFGAEPEAAFAVATLYQASRLLGSLLVGAWAASREGLAALRLYSLSKPGRDRPSSHHASS